jgi:hypothetical protein
MGERVGAPMRASGPSGRPDDNGTLVRRVECCCVGLVVAFMSLVLFMLLHRATDGRTNATSRVRHERRAVRQRPRMQPWKRRVLRARTVWWTAPLRFVPVWIVAIRSGCVCCGARRKPQPVLSGLGRGRRVRRRSGLLVRRGTATTRPRRSKRGSALAKRTYLSLTTTKETRSCNSQRPSSEPR